MDEKTKESWINNPDPMRMNAPLLLGRIIWHLIHQLGGQALIPGEALAATDDDNYRLTYSNLVERLDGKVGMLGDSIYLESFDMREIEGFPDHDLVMKHVNLTSVCERAVAFFKKRAEENNDS